MSGSGAIRLSRLSPDVSADWLDWLDGFHKAKSVVELRLLGLPTADGVFLKHWSDEARLAMCEFAIDHGCASVLFRHDRRRETHLAPRGGYLVPLQLVESETIRFACDSRLVMWLEPLCPYCDQYSLNALFDWTNGRLTIEIVGPGFDAGDLNRGDTSPHETYVFPLSRQGRLPLRAMPSHYARVSESEYSCSVHRRLCKIGRLSLGNTAATAEDLPETMLLELGRRIAETGSHVLARSMNAYAPIPSSSLSTFLSFISLLNRESLGSLSVVSGSFVQGGRLVFWDITRASSKYDFPAHCASP
jgi:hypothetical protein